MQLSRLSPVNHTVIYILDTTNPIPFSIQKKNVHGKRAKYMASKSKSIIHYSVATYLELNRQCGVGRYVKLWGIHLFNC